MSPDALTWIAYLGHLVVAIGFAATCGSRRALARRVAIVLGLFAVIPLLVSLALGAVVFREWPAADVIPRLMGSPIAVSAVASVLGVPAVVLLLAAIVRPGLLLRATVRGFLVVAAFLASAQLAGGLSTTFPAFPLHVAAGAAVAVRERFSFARAAAVFGFLGLLPLLPRTYDHPTWLIPYVAAAVASLAALMWDVLLRPRPGGVGRTA